MTYVMFIDFHSFGLIFCLVFCLVFYFCCMGEFFGGMVLGLICPPFRETRHVRWQHRH